MPLSLGGVFEAGLDIFAGQFREVFQNFGGVHALRERAEDVVHGDARAFDARFSAAFVRRDFEVVLARHHRIKSGRQAGGDYRSILPQPRTLSGAIQCAK